MPTQPKSQREKFEQTARELGVELDEEKLKEALRKIAPDGKTSRNDERTKGIDSDR